MMLDASTHAPFPDDAAFLDAEPLHLSETGDLDGFDFLLDGGDDLDALFPCTASLLNFEAALATSLDQMSVQEMYQPRRAPSKRNDLSQSLPPQRRRRLSISRRSLQLGGSLDFDPPSQQAQRHASQPDISSSTSLAESINRRVSETSYASQESTGQQSNYNQALQRLADSMRRTERSRDVVLAQRKMLTPEQQRALSSAKERLPQVSVPPPSSLVSQFFSGSRGTLTNGLEQSRKQLSSYMHVNRVNSAF